MKIAKKDHHDIQQQGDHGEDGDLLSALTKLEDEHDETLPSKLKFSILKLAKEKLIEVRRGFYIYHYFLQFGSHFRYTVA